jgi:hypothetical protein
MSFRYTTIFEIEHAFEKQLRVPPLRSPVATSGRDDSRCEWCGTYAGADSDGEARGNTAFPKLHFRRSREMAVRAVTPVLMVGA